MQVRGWHHQGCDNEELNAKSMNTEAGFCLRKSWMFIISSLEEGGRLPRVYLLRGFSRPLDPCTLCFSTLGFWLFKAPILLVFLGYFSNSLFLPTGFSSMLIAPYPSLA
jgi:hypothetical protein